MKLPYLLLGALAGALLTAPVATASDRPNVLLILVDDLKPALGCYGDPAAKTPHIDALAERGTRFDLAYCNQAVCAPSRFTLMLGSHSTSTGLYGLGSRLRETLPDAVTLPQHFARHGGYRTESLGKIFHIGHGNEGDPESFQEPHFHEKVIEYLDPASKPGGKLTREEAMFTNRKAPSGGMNRLPRGAAFEWPDVADDAYADGRVAAETRERLRRAADRRRREGTPFFIAAGFARPHLPFSAPKSYWDLHDPGALPFPENEELPAGSPTVAHKRGGEIRNYFPVPDKDDPAPIPHEVKRQLIHGYYASVSYVDAQIGAVLGELESLDLTDETIVVLWGDHGFHLGDLGIWTKHTNYEQANRIPLIIAAPGVGTPGSSTRQPAESVDLFPTLAELAGLPAPAGPQPIDGVSLVPVLRDPAARVRDHAYHAYPKRKMGRAIRTERHRLVEWSGGGGKPEFELYDYEEDPRETRNLVSEQAAVAARIKEILATYPEPVSPAVGRQEQGKASPPPSESPRIAGKTIRIVTETKAPKPEGVVIAQGGREHGYSLHFSEGKAVFDVRINGVVTRIEDRRPVRGTVKLTASLTADRMSLTIDSAGRSRTLEEASPGLIPAQPTDPLSVGLDIRSAAGDYEAPSPFNGTILYTRVDAGGKPPAVAEVMDRSEIAAGIEAHDRALFVANFWIRDPYITRGPDGIYYLTGTTPAADDPREATDPYNTGLGEESLVGWKARVWRSGNLIDWESLGSPYSLKDGIWFRADPDAFAETARDQWRLWAPELHWLPVAERWALVHTSPSPVTGANLSLSAGPDLAGPWENPFGTELGRRHDPSLFRDDDGTWWMVWGATSIAPLKTDFSSFAADPVTIGPSGATARMGHEGCLLVKIEGRYVLFGTGWSTGEMRRGSYNLYYATADEITGPYSERKFAGRFLGHGTPFRDDRGRWWCTAFYNANVPPVAAEGIETRDLSATAQTINRRGTTLVPLDVRLLADGSLHIRAKDPAYGTVGPDEAQDFGEASRGEAEDDLQALIPGRWPALRDKTRYDSPRPTGTP